MPRRLPIAELMRELSHYYVGDTSQALKELPSLAGSTCAGRLPTGSTGWPSRLAEPGLASAGNEKPS